MPPGERWTEATILAWWTQFGPAPGAVEELMRRYYLHARAVVSVVERFASAARVPVRKRPRIARVDSTLLLFNGKLAVKDPTIFDQRPAEMVRIFRVACELDVSIYAHTKDLIEDRLAEGRISLAGDPRASRLLLDALIDDRDRRQPSLLEQMHQVGLVNELLPEFAPCTCRVQHDLYHVYTVDQHQLKTVAMLKRAFRGEEKDIGGHIPSALEAVDLETLLLERRDHLVDDRVPRLGRSDGLILDEDLPLVRLDQTDRQIQRLIAQRLKLMHLVRLNMYCISHGNLRPLVAQQHAPPAMHHHNAMLMQMLIQCRVAARRNGEVADNKIVCALIWSNQHPLHRARRCPALGAALVLNGRNRLIVPCCCIR